MAIYGYTKNYKLIKPKYDTDTWHDYEYDNLDTIDAVLSAIYASGNWKGFWATNTAYVVGDVVIDRDTDTMYKVMVDHTTSEATFAAEQTAHPGYYELWSPNNLAESWATKTDGKVSNEDYSAKAYAISSGLTEEGSAKEWAIGSGAIGNTNEYSAKKYATDAHNDYTSMTTNPNVVAVGSNIANVNAVGQSISNVNTVAGNVASVNTVAGVSTDVTTVAGISTDVSTVANNSANVTTVATNISDVNTAASNIAAILAAPTAATNAAQSATNAANSATISANSATASATSAQAAQDALNDVQGLIATPIGTIFQSVYVDESLDIARQLNGQLISSTKFTGFRNWLNTVQTATPNLFTTETNWQAEKTNSKLGQCGKFVVDDTAGTIRLPCVVNAQGLTDLALIGGIKSESLPNITGSFEQQRTTEGGETGAFYFTVGTKSGSVTPQSDYLNGTINLDASRSSSTYQDNAPVQQEAVQYPYYIQVATGVEETLPAIREYNINTPFFFGQSMYSDIAPDNASWLVSNGQWNAKTVYPDYYDWLLTQYNNPTESNVVKSGSLADNNGVLSGFSSANNALLPVTFSPANNPWEIVIKFKTPQTFTEQGLLCKTHQSGVNYGLRIALAANGALYYLIGSSYNTYICEGLGVKILSADTNYYVKFEFTGEAYKAYISTNAETWTEDFSFSTTTPIESFDEPTYLGDNKYKNNPLSGSIDLNESYININGQRWWNGRKAIVVKTGETSIFSDYDFVINTTDQTFRLPLKNGQEGIFADNTVPSRRNLYYYVGDTVQDASLINAGAVLGQLSNKISRTSASDREMVVGWGMPNYNASVDITASVAAGYTATYKQCVVVQCSKNANQSSSATITINNISYNMAVTSSNNQWNESNTLFLILDVGDTLKTNSTNAVWYIVAYPLKGA